jgi:hypothetical protein
LLYFQANSIEQEQKMIENEDEINKLKKSIDLLFLDGANQNTLINYMLASLQKIQNQVDAFNNDGLENIKRSSRDDIVGADDIDQYYTVESLKQKLAKLMESDGIAKRSRKQLFSSGLQGVWGVPGKK